MDTTDLLFAGYSLTIRERFHARLLRSPNGCLEWTGARRSTGYGHISRGTRSAGNEATHRLAWILANGPIPPGLVVCHRCDNPPCCNPEHLFLGTMSDNTRDMLNKGRGLGQIPAGADHPSARLTDNEVAQLRADHATTPNYAELGRRYGVSKQHARALVLGLKRTS